MDSCDKKREVKFMDKFFEEVSPPIALPLETIEQEENFGGNYPIDNTAIQKKYFLIEKNKDFYRCFCLDKNETVILYKKWEHFLPASIECWKIRTYINLTAENKLPVKDRMCLIWDKLAYWDDQEEEFKLVEKWGLEFRWVKSVSGNRIEIFQMVLWNWKELNFSRSKKNPKEPATLVMNWEIFFLQHTSDNRSFITSKEWDYTEIEDYEKPIIINSRTFLRLDWRFQDYVTDGTNKFKFQKDSGWNIRTYEYKGKSCPILETWNIHMGFLFSEDQKNRWIKICYFDKDSNEEIILIKEDKEWIDAKHEQGETPADHIRLRFNAEQAKLHVIKIMVDHGIVCLASDSSNTSRYEFYRINTDGSLTFAFRDNYNLKINDWKVKVSYSKSNREALNYTLVRRPGTTSVFEPLVLNWSEYLVAEWGDSGEIVYISIDDHCSITEEKIEINPTTFLPTNTFTINDEILHYNKDWTIKILDNYYKLSDPKWNDILNIEEAIIWLWIFKLLILKKADNFEDELFIYVLWAKCDHKELSKVNHREQFSENSYGESKGLQIIGLDGIETICKYDYSSLKALWIYDTFENGYSSLRYICKKEDGKSLEWEEFLSEWEKVVITDMISEEYLNSNWTIYYRPKMWRDLVKIELPEWVDFFRWPYCEIDNASISPFLLKMKEWKLVPLSDKYKDFYQLEDEKGECELNWKRTNILNVWDKEKKRVISLVKKWSIIEPLIIWWYNVLNAYYWTFVFYTSDSDKPKIICLYDNNLEVAKTPEETTYLILNKEDEQKDTRWRSVYDLRSWIGFVWPIYKVGQEVIVMNIIREWYRITVSKSWEILVNGIEMSKALLDGLYERYKPEWAIKKVVWGVSKKVKNLSEGKN